MSRRRHWQPADERDMQLIRLAHTQSLAVRVPNAGGYVATATLIGWGPKRARVRFRSGGECSVPRDTITLPDPLPQLTETT